MSVTIDHEMLAVESLGLNTVGQVLSHVSRGNRLVVNLLIDGAQPDLALIGEIRLKYQVANFSRILGTLLQGGLPLVPAMETAGESMSSRQMLNGVTAAAERVRTSRACQSQRSMRWRSAPAASFAGRSPAGASLTEKPPPPFRRTR